MSKTIAGVLTTVSGVVVARIGQGIMSTDWDALWATAAVVSILAGVSIAMSGTIHRQLSPITRRAAGHV